MRVQAYRKVVELMCNHIVVVEPAVMSGTVRGRSTTRKPSVKRFVNRQKASIPVNAPNIEPKRNPRRDIIQRNRWAGNIWASTGCTSDISDKYDHPTVSTCVTNHCPSDGVCSDYWGPSGVTSKAEFAMQEGGLDFYDVSLIDGWV